MKCDRCEYRYECPKSGRKQKRISMSTFIIVCVLLIVLLEHIANQ